MSVQVNTVLGPIDSSRLGVTLIHEHLKVALLGFEMDPFNTYDRTAALHDAVDNMKELRELGVSSRRRSATHGAGAGPRVLRRGSRSLRDAGHHLDGGRPRVPCNAALLQGADDGRDRGDVRERPHPRHRGHRHQGRDHQGGHRRGSHYEKRGARGPGGGAGSAEDKRADRDPHHPRHDGSRAGRDVHGRGSFSRQVHDRPLLPIDGPPLPTPYSWIRAASWASTRSG